jgi:hypothetical protein
LRARGEAKIASEGGVQPLRECCVACSCPECKYPSLFVTLDNQKGSAASHPAQCPDRDRNYYIAVNEDRQEMTDDPEVVNAWCMAGASRRA